MRKLLLASNNPDKAREFAQILAGLPLEIVTPGDLGLDLEVEETGATFAENAALKAHAYQRTSGLLALADDSGIEIDALEGGPGVYSARWGGIPNGSEKNRVLLRQLEGVPLEKRGCRYVCEIAIVDERGRLRRCRGTLRGVVALEPRGQGGFGFDPVFYVPSRKRTVAEMAPEEKHQISHRGRAGRCARRVLERLLAETGERNHQDTKGTKMHKES